jgi:hypothetical protein
VTKEIYRRAVDLLEADINDELVGLDPARGSCFGLNSVGKDVWRKLERPRSFEELKAELLAEYDVSDEQCTEELHAFLAEMEAKGLIAADTAPAGRSA